VRAAVRAWRRNDGPEIMATDPRVESDSTTSVLLPDGHDAERVRQIALERFNVSLGGGLDRLKGHVFRIGHMGDLNEPMILGALGVVELSLGLAGVPHGKGGVEAAIEHLAQ
jgi:alanine-glyoxylate transaminase / serine-glyoxylate transaminase / serine-pyruvate transaminase